MCFIGTCRQTFFTIRREITCKMLCKVLTGVNGPGHMGMRKLYEQADLCVMKKFVDYNMYLDECAHHPVFSDWV
jgi:hypothetical protein